MIAAMMTAANLGARVTGWGFAVFTVGSIAWSVVGLLSGQTNLLATNAFLTIVNLIGIWRWLGRQRAYEDGGKSAQEASRRSPAPTLFAATGIAGTPVVTSDGHRVGKVAEALIACDEGRVSYVVVGSGGVGGLAEEMRAIPRDDIRFAADTLALRGDSDWFAAIPVIKDGAWPAAAGARLR